MQLLHTTAAATQLAQLSRSVRTKDRHSTACIRRQVCAVAWQKARLAVSVAFRGCCKATSPRFDPCADVVEPFRQGNIDLTGRGVAILWDFDNLRPPGGSQAAVLAAHRLQVGADPSVDSGGSALFSASAADDTASTQDDATPSRCVVPQAAVLERGGHAVSAIACANAVTLERCPGLAEALRARGVQVVPVTATKCAWPSHSQLSAFWLMSNGRTWVTHIDSRCPCSALS